MTSILNTKKSRDSNNPKYFTNYGEAQEYIKKLEEEYINQEVPRDSYTYKGSELLYKENQEKRERNLHANSIRSEKIQQRFFKQISMIKMN